MMKKLGMALLVAGMFLAVAAFDMKDSTARADDAGGDTEPEELVLDLGNKVMLKLVQIPAGKFLIGSPKDEHGRQDNEGLPPGKWVNGNPQFEVTISKAFYLGVYEVTVDQYEQFLEDTGTKHEEPRFKQTGDHPAVNVSWSDAQAFCKWLSRKTGKMVVLPTEAQWEYACRAGSKTRFNFGDKPEDPCKYGNYYDKSDYYKYNGDGSLSNLSSFTKMSRYRDGFAETAPVGSFKPNTWGLYDMHGNAFEWCADYYGNYAGAGADPTGPKDGGILFMRVLRGGSWNNWPKNCRSAYRGKSFPDSGGKASGFRVAVVGEEKEKKRG